MPVVVKIDDDVIEEIAEIEGRDVGEVRERIVKTLEKFAEFGVNQLYRSIVEMAGMYEEVDIDVLKDMAFNLGVSLGGGVGGEEEGCRACEESE